MYHFLSDKSAQNVASHLKINPYFVKEYQISARKYNTKKVVDIISYLREYDLKSKGVNNTSTLWFKYLMDFVEYIFDVSEKLFY